MSALRLFDPTFDTLVRSAFGPVATWPRVTGFTPAAEVSRDGDDAVVRVELPGVDVENDVTVEVEDGRLVVRGQRKDERAEERDGRKLHEIRYGEFQRSFGLPAHITGDAVSASYDAGVLSIKVAGTYAAADKQRIAISR